MLLSRLNLALVFAAASAAAALAAPTIASAEPAFYEVEYNVDFEATAKWTLDRTDESHSGTVKDTHTLESETRLSGTLESIMFRNGQLLNAGVPFGFAEQVTTGGGQGKHEQWDQIDKRWITTTGPCTATPSYPPGTIRLGRDTSSGPVNGAALVARFADEPVATFDCPKTSNGGAALGNHAAFPGGTFDARFTLPAETIGMGKIIQLVSGRSDQQSPAWCPGESNTGGATTRACTFSWTGKLTFTKVGDYQYNGDLPPSPTPTPPGTTPPPTGRDPRAEAISWAVEQYGKENPVDPRAEAISKAVEQYGKDIPVDPRAEAISWAVEQYGKELQFEASCPTGCNGTAEILPGSSGSSGSSGGKATPRAYMAKRKALAKLRFKVAPGRRHKVRLKLSPKVRAAVRRAGGAKVRITLTPKGGKPVTRTLAVPRRK